MDPMILAVEMARRPEDGLWGWGGALIVHPVPDLLDGYRKAFIQFGHFAPTDPCLTVDTDRNLVLSQESVARAVAWIMTLRRIIQPGAKIEIHPPSCPHGPIRSPALLDADFLEALGHECHLRLKLGFSDQVICRYQHDGVLASLRSIPRLKVIELDFSNPPDVLRRLWEGHVLERRHIRDILASTIGAEAPIWVSSPADLVLPKVSEFFAARGEATRAEIERRARFSCRLAKYEVRPLPSQTGPDLLWREAPTPRPTFEPRIGVSQVSLPQLPICGSS